MSESEREESPLLEERHGHVMVLTLNRPKALNSIDPGLAQALRDAWSAIETDDETWVTVLTGTGQRAFCVGADLKRTPPPAGSFVQTFLSGGSNPNEIGPPLSALKPVICAINGLALGGGLELAMSTDIQIAAPEVKLGLTETKVGSLPGAGGTQRLARRLPIGIAQRMLLTAEMMDAETALRYGLISEIVPADELLDHALVLAELICANAPLSVRAARRAAYASQDLPLNRGLELEQMLWGLLRDTEDRLEGRRAFAEKRPPAYRGR